MVMYFLCTFTAQLQTSKRKTMSQKLSPTEVELLSSIISESRRNRPMYISASEEYFWTNAIDALIERGEDQSLILADHVGLHKFYYMSKRIRAANLGSILLLDFGKDILNPNNSLKRRLDLDEIKTLQEVMMRDTHPIIMDDIQQKSIDIAFLQIQAGLDGLGAKTLFNHLPKQLAVRISRNIRQEFSRHPTLRHFALGMLSLDKDVIGEQLSKVFLNGIFPAEDISSVEQDNPQSDDASTKKEPQDDIDLSTEEGGMPTHLTPQSPNSDYKGVYVEMPKPNNEQLFDDVRQLLDLTKLTKYADVKSKIAEARLFDKGLVNRFSNFCFITEKGIQYLSDLNLLQCENLDGSTYCHHQY